MLAGYGSNGPALPRIAALSEMIRMLFQHFGPRQIASRDYDFDEADPDDMSVDLVIVTKKGANVLSYLTLDPEHIRIEEFDGPPIMLAFEAQRVLGEHVGQYDVYGMMEDDLIIHDPLFFDKLLWFSAQFPGNRILQPHRFEISKAGRIAKFLIEPKFKERNVLFSREGQVRFIESDWRGYPVAFELPNNPHSGCSFVTDQQLKFWTRQPWFYDKEVNWEGPLESAATSSLARTFDVYRPVERQSNFFEVEHYGVRASNHFARKEGKFYQATLLDMLEAELREAAPLAEDRDNEVGTAKKLSMTFDPRDDAELLIRENIRLREIIGSRSKLLRQLLNTIGSKF